MTVKTRSATIAAKDNADFAHKAVHAMAAYGTPRTVMGSLLGLSLRSIRRHLSRPCAAYEAEVLERTARRELENRNRALGNKFCQADDYLSDKAIYLRDLRKNIARMWSEGMSASGIGYELGVSRQVVQYHVGSLVRDRGVANPLTCGRRARSTNKLIIKNNVRNQQVQKIYI